MASHGSEIEEFLRFYGLSVALSDAKGRCLVASRPFQRGKWISFSLQTPRSKRTWWVVLLLLCKATRCTLCFLFGREFSRFSLGEGWICLWRGEDFGARAVCGSPGSWSSEQAMWSLLHEVQYCEAMLCMQECLLLLRRLPGNCQRCPCSAWGFRA